MSSSFKFIRKIRKDPLYFHKYYAWILLLTIMLIAILFNVKSISFHIFLLFIPGMLLLRSTHFFLNGVAMIYCLALAYLLEGFSVKLMSYSLLAIFWQLTTNSLLHLASHDSFWRSWVSRTIGESLAFFYLVGFPEWQQIHMQHHQFPDHPDKDPHPPEGLTFVAFLLSMRKSVSKVFVAFLHNVWPQNKNTNQKLKWLAIMAITSQCLKIVFWYLILGPIGFGSFYAINLVVKNISYAHFNYYTHLQKTDGIEIINLKDGLFWKLLNTITFGLYYHKNHHIRPNLFNPSTLVINQKETKKAINTDAIAC